MRRRHVIFLTWMAGLLSALSGCSGGGGTVVIDPIFFRVELPGRDPLNIEPGQQVQFVLAGYDASNRRAVLTAEGWALTYPSGDPGVLDPVTGLLSAGSGGSGQVVAFYRGNLRVPLDIAVRPLGLARLRGTVRSDSGTPAAGVVVLIFNSSNQEVGRATVLSDGRFTALVPTTADRINFLTSSMTGYLLQWLYRNKYRQAGDQIPNCHALFVASPMPLQPNQTSTIGDPFILFPAGSPPPPPPDGCGQ
ncbi:MAG: carboxypeptidase-like regulatory domain-containing protein [Fimbriimonadales bacterium]|nr:carboxypeptidase-like regulatory domain-containing protein [Fimbriimonadales bacterium]